MDDKETVTKDEEQLDHLEEEIQQARHRLEDEMHSERKPEFIDDDQEDHEEVGNNQPPG